MKEVFKKSGIKELKNFENFSFDNESLNTTDKKGNLSLGNNYVSIGNPVAPKLGEIGVMSDYNFSDLLERSQKKTGKKLTHRE